MGGVEVGFLIANVPFLHPDTWKGAAIPLTNQNIPGQRTPSKDKAP